MTDNDPGFSLDDKIIRSDNVKAALYFLASGDYLFRWQDAGSSRFDRDLGLHSKCLSEIDVSSAFGHKEIDSGWLPAGVIRWGFGPAGRMCVSEIPAQTIKITMEKAVPAAGKKTRVKKYTFKLATPHMVLVGTGTRYAIFALDGPFTPGRAAFHAPFPNINGSGWICFGSTNKVPEAKPENMAAAWKLFVDAPFNDHQRDGKSKSHPDDIRNALMECAGKAEYPLSDLVPMHSTIGALVDNIARKGTVDDD